MRIDHERVARAKARLKDAARESWQALLRFRPLEFWDRVATRRNFVLGVVLLGPLLFGLADYATAPPPMPSYGDARAAWAPSEAWLYDRDGNLIDSARVNFQARRLAWTPLDQVAPVMRDTLVAAEDRRFRYHGGVDWVALAGALRNHLGGRHARGASTLTMQLAAFARNQFNIGHAAMQMNEGLALQLIDDLKRQYDLSKMTVGLLGMAFKAEIDDVRASLSYKLKRTLLTNAREVLTTDPFVTIDPAIKALDEVVAKSDLLILCTPHSAYKEADFSGKPVVDIWGFLKNANVVY